jgi:peptide/nickel transport system substrate-binding protein
MESVTMRGPTFHRLSLLGMGLLTALVAGHAAAASLTVALQTDASSMDPHVAPTFTTAALQDHIYGSLIALDPALNLMPNLALSWRALDATKWLIELRPDVRFSDGQPFGAKDVAYSIRRATTVRHAAGTAAPYVKAISGVTVLDPLRLELETQTPYPQLPLDLARLRIVPASLGEAVTTEDFNRGTAAIGTGPYRLGRWRPGETLELARNPEYRGEAPEWDSVTFRPIASDAARLAALLSGSVDLIDKVPTPDVARLRGQGSVEIFAHEGNRTMFLVPDTARETTPFATGADDTPLPTNPLRDPRVRQAISLAINRTALVDRVLEGLGTTANQAAPAGMFGGSPRIPPAEWQPARARTLLAEAGYPQGFKLVLHCSNGRYLADRATCQAVAQMLTRAGIVTAAEAEPQSVFYTRMARFDASLLLNGWGSIGDNLMVLRQALHSVDADRGLGGFNRGRYANAEVDRLTDAAAATLDDGERALLQQQAMETAMADGALVPLYTPNWVWAARKGLRYTPGFDEGTFAMRASGGR